MGRWVIWKQELRLGLPSIFSCLDQWNGKSIFEFHRLQSVRERSRLREILFYSERVRLEKQEIVPAETIRSQDDLVSLE